MVFLRENLAWLAAEKLSRSPSTPLRACPEFIEGTNGGVLISSRIFRSTETVDA